MRLWHLVFGVAGVGIVLALLRDPMSRAMILVFATGLGVTALALASVMALFQTVGSIGMAHGLAEYAEALAATVVVLMVGTAAMCGWLFVGCWSVSVFV